MSHSKMTARKEIDELLISRVQYLGHQVLQTIVDPLRSEMHTAEYVVRQMRRDFMRSFLDKEHELIKAELATKGLALSSCWGRCL